MARLTVATFSACVLLTCLSIAGCGRSTDLRACKIADKSCQEDIYYAVVRLRGDGFDPFDGLPPIRTITLDQYRDELFGDQPPPAPAEMPDMPDEEPEKPMVKPWDVALQWLGLIAPATTGGQAVANDRLNTVAAFYTWDTQTVTVIDRPEERNDQGDTTLLAHELVHAFQDNEVAATPADGTSDGSFAGSALIEGEARMYEYLAWAETQQLAPRQVEWHKSFQGDVVFLRERLAEAPSPFYSTFWFIYSLGADRLMQGWLRGGNAAVRHLAKTAPRHTLDYMAEHEGLSIEPTPALACEVTGPEKAFALVGGDRFGALELFAFLTAADVPNDSAWETALAWRDDRVWLFFDAESEEVAVTWRIRLSDEDAADRVVAAAMTRPQLRAERRGRDALIVGSEAERADWRGARDCD